MGQYNVNNSFDTKFTISSDKNNYFCYEDIYINYYILNNDENGPKIDGIDYFIINNKEGKSFKLMFHVNKINIPSMKPGEVITGKRNISVIYENPDSIMMKSKISGYDFIPGQYSIQGIWKEDNRFLYSNSIVINIIYPIADEANALYMFINGLMSQYHNDNENEYNTFMELSNKFPKSVYALAALSNASIVYYFNDSLEKSKNIIKPCKKMLEDYSNDEYYKIAISRLLHYYHKKGDTLEPINYLMQLKNKTNKNNLKEEIDKAIKRIEK